VTNVHQKNDNERISNSKGFFFLKIDIYVVCENFSRICSKLLQFFTDFGGNRKSSSEFHFCIED
jgi:hypothetical protein